MYLHCLGCVCVCVCVCVCGVFLHWSGSPILERNGRMIFQKELAKVGAIFVPGKYVIKFAF